MGLAQTARTHTHAYSQVVHIQTRLDMHGVYWVHFAIIIHLEDSGEIMQLNQRWQ